MSNPPGPRAHWPVAGPKHPAVLRYLAVRTGRDPDRGAVALEGLFPLRRALDAGAPVESVLVCPALARGEATWRAAADARDAGADVVAVGERLARRLVARDGPDGVAGIARRPEVGLDALALGPADRVLVLDGLESAGNIGSLVRTADGAGARAVVATGVRTRLNHPGIVRASMGSLFTTPIVAADPAATRRWLRARGARIVAADPAATASYRGDHYRGPVAVVVGRERAGLTAGWRAAADVLVAIPMLGAADSLNVGHAASLLLYEALHRQRSEPPSRLGR